jgi:hypothetical protein
MVRQNCLDLNEGVFSDHCLDCVILNEVVISDRGFDWSILNGGVFVLFSLEHVR